MFAVPSRGSVTPTTIHCLEKIFFRDLNYKFHQTSIKHIVQILILLKNIQKTLSQRQLNFTLANSKKPTINHGQHRRCLMCAISCALSCRQTRTYQRLKCHKTVGNTYSVLFHILKCNPTWRKTVTSLCHKFSDLYGRETKCNIYLQTLHTQKTLKTQKMITENVHCLCVSMS